MEVKESNDHRCYMSEYGIPTIQLGDGGVTISSLKDTDNNYAGVGFSLGSGRIGEMKEVGEGVTADKYGVFFQVLATDPASLQVLIDRLREAKADLIQLKLNDRL